MYGVVLWSDKKQNRAVIWCEDHRNLAFYKDESNLSEASLFVPGDLVEFDLREVDDMRLAVDPCVVSAHEFPSLPGDLKAAKANLRRNKIAPPIPSPRKNNVVALHPRGTPKAHRAVESAYR